MSSPSGVVLGFFSKGLKGEGEGRVQEFEVEYFWQHKKGEKQAAQKRIERKTEKHHLKTNCFERLTKTLEALSLSRSHPNRVVRWYLEQIVTGTNLHA